MSDEVKLTWGKTEHDLSERWPKDAGGKNEQPVFLTRVMDTNAEADMLCSMLRAYGIPVLRKYEGEGSFGKIVLGIISFSSFAMALSSFLSSSLSAGEASHFSYS